MYDRKTWIVVIVCSVLIAINLHFSKKNADAIAAQRAAELAANPPEEKTAEGGVAEKPGVLEEKPIEASADEKTYELRTDRTTFTLTTLGGGVKTAELEKQMSVVEEDGHVTLNEGSPSPVGALADGADRMETGNYEYVDTQSEPGRSVVFLGKHPSGLVVKKIYSLVPVDEVGSDFLLDLEIQLENTRENSLPLDQFSLFLGTALPLHERELTPSGFFWREDGDFHFVKAVKEGKVKESFFSGAQEMIMKTEERMDYGGVSSQLFATVLKSKDVTSGGIWSKGQDRTLTEGGKMVAGVRAGYNLPTSTLGPGERQSFRYQLFMGPKDNRMLRKMGEGWGDIMNYGFFSIVSRTMSSLLGVVHDGVSKISTKWSWGFAIIIVTLVVRGVMWPLYAKSNKTMKRMGLLKPEMDKLKEKYPDDPAKVQQEVMGLYRKFGINPLGGCLPMLLQIPIFFGFYRMLQYAVELRGQEFLWVTDLSLPDTVWTIPIMGGIPLNILPIVMGLSSFGQMAMMPNTSGDKTQQTIMKMMPLMFFFFCYNFAAALALYWTTSNVFSIAQTWITKRMGEPELKVREGGGGKSFMQKMAERAEEAQKMKQARGRVVDDEAPKKKRGPRTGG